MAIEFVLGDLVIAEWLGASLADALGDVSALSPHLDFCSKYLQDL